MARVYIGIGSNMSNPAHQCRRAIDRLEEAGEVVAVSPLYETAPWGDSDQDAFVNAVACLETALSPRELLARLQNLENTAGRVRTERRWGPRVLDLDIVLYADCVLDEPHLTLPHPRFRERRFVLAPLADIAADCRDPVTGRTIGALLAACPDASRVTRLDNTATGHTMGGGCE